MEKCQGIVCPNICKKIERQRHESRNCFPSWAGEGKFEVQHFIENHIVYLWDRHYSCGMFQLVGFPCCHAIASISYHKLSMEEYVDDYFKKDAYLRVYGHMINNVPRMHDYEELPLGIVEPPQVKSKPGRPKKVRRRDANDIRDGVVSMKGVTHTCENCLRTNHNKKSCTNPTHPNSKHT
ncbi:UNVERIFIED_CONTAM: hypothetical protein Sangu_3065300 [Sesamum angustifolium]|uniref:Zinc finger PMZ-type domain-containing protein n=1 Tax=Sesamum angustifolium TaxID=2727405 RepID=A0AAW2KF13_9LAMI